MPRAECIFFRHPSRLPPICLAAAVCIVGVWPSKSLAGFSDPVRNHDPEQPTPPDDVENPIYYNGPMIGSNIGEVDGVIPEALLHDFLNRHSSLNYAAAVESAMRLIEAVPDRPIGYYNLACSLSRMGRTQEALDALRNAVDRGWRDVVHTNIDPDFAPLRSEARFDELIAEIRSRSAAERIAPAPLRSDPWESVVADLLEQTPGLLAQHHVPGATVALIRDGEVVWNAAFGSRDGKGATPLGAEDRFRLRAPLHYLAIAACDRLEQQQKMQLAPLIAEAANQHGQITIVEARGGTIGGGAQPANLRDRPSNDRGPQASESVASVRMPARMFARNSAYGFLRMAIEESAEQSFPTFCEQSLFGPFAMRTSGFSMPAADVAVITGHSALGTPLRSNVMQGEFAPGGCIYTTAGDIARLIAAGIAPGQARAEIGAGDAIREGALPIGNAAIFDEDSAQMEAQRLAHAIDVVTQADAATSGSLGMSIKRTELETGVCYQMDEAAAGIVLLALWHPVPRSGIVIICNSVTAKAAAERIAHIALGGE